MDKMHHFKFAENLGPIYVLNILNISGEDDKNKEYYLLYKKETDVTEAVFLRRFSLNDYKLFETSEEIEVCEA
jgi:hypothetical protein